MIIPGILYPDTGVQKSTENKHVTFTSKISAEQVKAGGSVKLFFTLIPMEGVHINTDPQMDFEFEKNSVVDFVGVGPIPTDTSTGYLLSGKSIVYNVKIHANALPATYTIRGAVKYFYCSDAEGWCNRFSQSVAIPVTVVK
jgi:hypothetical protein